MPLRRAAAAGTLLLAGAAALSAGTLSFGVAHHLDTAAYDVIDEKRQLKASLEFPSRYTTTTFGYVTSVPWGRWHTAIECVVNSADTTGSDKDWFEGQTSVYSESVSALALSYALESILEIPLTRVWSLQTKAAYRHTVHSWSQTEQRDYYQASEVYFPDETVRFTQRQYSAGIGLRYSDTFFTIPLHLFGGIDIVRHDSIDEHIVRAFYTRSEGWMKGFYTGLEAELAAWDEGFSLLWKSRFETHYGDTDMRFYTSRDVHYMTLPATFRRQNLQSGLQLLWRY